MNIQFVKEQFEIAKKASHLAETIVIDIKTVEQMISEIERLKERNSRYAETIERLKMDKYTLEIDCKFKHDDIKRLEKEIEALIEDGVKQSLKYQTLLGAWVNRES